ncbi:MAG: hypothetical protein ISS71_02005 [Phycisphaerae bacterium]|nr:hypothetical protein [Phycisphaerae bacterium]
MYIFVELCMHFTVRQKCGFIERKKEKRKFGGLQYQPSNSRGRKDRYLEPSLRPRTFLLEESRGNQEAMISAAFILSSGK